MNVPVLSLTLSSTFLLTIVIGLLILLLFQFYIEPFHNWFELPGPPRLPLLGNLQTWTYAKRHDFHNFFFDTSRKYGKIARIQLGSM